MANILCKIFGHRMYFHGCDIARPSYCTRHGCNHTEPQVSCGNAPMPEIKPPKYDARSVVPVEALQYKGFFGTAQVSVCKNVISGRVLGTKKLFVYKGNTPKEAYDNFCAIIDNCLDNSGDM